MTGAEPLPPELEVTAGPVSSGEIRLIWHRGNEQLKRRFPASAVAELERRTLRLYERLAQGYRVEEELAGLGRALGDLLVGPDHAREILRWVGNHPDELVLCRVAARGPVAALPWELLQLPGAPDPLLFFSGAAGGLELVRDHPPLGAAGRQVTDKCLASISTRGDLLVQREVDELRARLLRHPTIRFRWVLNPGAPELMARLQLECALFLFAGHGRLEGDGYVVELASGPVDVREIVPSLGSSRAEVLIFDSCDSGSGGGDAGLPSLLSALPSATCLLGMQGPTDDTLSCWHMPALVERLLLGETVWSCVHLLRRLLYENNSDFWFSPVLHLKRTYRPFATSPEVRSYLGALERLVEERKRGGGSSSTGRRTAGSPSTT